MVPPRRGGTPPGRRLPSQPGGQQARTPGEAPPSGPGRMGAMPLPVARTPLSELDPPIALGALDGRYRGAVAPLVDHLSEAALNRARLHVEVEWLVHLTTHDVVPGADHLSDDEQAALRE